MRHLLLVLCCCALEPCIAQRILTRTEALAVAGPGPVHVTALHADSLCSSFLIRVDSVVAPHLHRFHTEHVVVLEGEGEMLLGDTVRTLRAGDTVVIPRNTPHAVKVTSAVPLRVISVQSPRFDGSDRVPLDTPNR
jgi:mannose-6-phosphate isomerase-like protein (cupin superfamily)